jgi:hypothetical protein
LIKEIPGARLVLRVAEISANKKIESKDERGNIPFCHEERRPAGGEKGLLILLEFLLNRRHRVLSNIFKLLLSSKEAEPTQAEIVKMMSDAFNNLLFESSHGGAGARGRNSFGYCNV